MTQVTVDQALLQSLGGMSEPVVLCSPDGAVLGHFLPEAEYQRILYGSLNTPYSDEEIARRRAQTGGCSLDDIWHRVGQK